MGAGNELIRHSRRVIQELDASLAGTAEQRHAFMVGVPDRGWESLCAAADNTPFSGELKTVVLGELKARADKGVPSTQIIDLFEALKRSL